ncbi:MAG: STAS domain-containing protein [Proteobacteria bacterium]|nr:STAS domain-containing protein [Pseudomonadota bacterium]MDA0862868.1 STAS domain-containing protein [Pseudomonadota bacterium]MDA1031561.1 STAS domain-containing protein [Pseudomonadota bacterium]
MIVDDSGDRRFGVTGNLVMTTYNEQQQKAISALEQGRVIIDFQKLQEFDSSAVAFMLECVRSSKGQAKFSSLPKALRGLIDLYGVADLLDISRG